MDAEPAPIGVLHLEIGRFLIAYRCMELLVHIAPDHLRQSPPYHLAHKLPRLLAHHREDLVGPLVHIGKLPLTIERNEGITDAFEDSADAQIRAAHRILGATTVGDIVEDEDHPDHRPAGIANRSGAVVDRCLAPVARDKHRVIGKPDDGLGCEHLLDRIIRHCPCLLVDDVEDCRQPLPYSIVPAPAGHLPRYLVHEYHHSVGIGSDHSIADTR